MYTKNGNELKINLHCKTDLKAVKINVSKLHEAVF